LWYKEEGTLSIHKITNDRREIFYWVIVLITFALGTAVGDTVSEHLNFGYLNSYENYHKYIDLFFNRNDIPKKIKDDKWKIYKNTPFEIIFKT
jgi:uncharacterized membrane-anchored protein